METAVAQAIADDRDRGVLRTLTAEEAAAVWAERRGNS